MTRQKNLDTAFNRYRSIARPYHERLERGKIFLQQLDDFVIESPEQWEDYKRLAARYEEIREDVNAKAVELRQIQEDLRA